MTQDLTTITPQRAALYLRISKDHTGKGEGVERHEEECREWAEAHGWGIAAVFTDNDVSASTGKRRDSFDEMLRAVRSGECDGIIAKEASRLVRRISDYAELLDLQVPVQTHRGDVNLTTPAGRMQTTIMVGVAQNEVEQKAERQRSANRQRARQGKVYGRVMTWGWTDLACTQHDPAKVEMMRTAAANILAGASLNEVAKQWNMSGIKSNRGKEWNAAIVQQVLLRPVNAGIVQYEGQELPDVTAQWLPIFDRATFTALKSTLSARRSYTGQRNRVPQKYLLSKILICDKCDSPMHAKMAGKREQYTCYASGCYRTIARKSAEDTVTNYVAHRLAWLVASDLYSEDQMQLQTALAAQVEQIRTDREELAKSDASMSTKLSFAAELDRQEQTLSEQLAGVTAGNALAKLVMGILPSWQKKTGGALSVSIDAHAANVRAIRERFTDLTIGQKRVIISAYGTYRVSEGRTDRIEITKLYPVLKDIVLPKS